MRALGVVEHYPVADYAPGVEAVGDFFEIDRFLFQGPPEPFDEDVVHAAAPAIHRDSHAGLGQCGDPGRSGELRPLDALLRVKRRSGTD